MKLPPFKQPQILLIAGGGVGLLALAVYLFFFAPLQAQIRTKAAEVSTLEAEAAQARETVLRAGKEGLGRRLIPDREISQVIDELTQQGKRFGIYFVSIKPGEAQKSEEGTHRLLPLQMETESSYQALGEFLGVLDDLEKGLVTVEEFRVASEPEKATSLRTRLSVNLYLTE